MNQCHGLNTQYIYYDTMFLGPVFCFTELVLTKVILSRGEDIGSGRRYFRQKGFCSFRPYRWPKATLFTFLFTYIGVSVLKNFYLLPEPMSSPLNYPA